MKNICYTSFKELSEKANLKKLGRRKAIGSKSQKGQDSQATEDSFSTGPGKNKPGFFIIGDFSIEEEVMKKNRFTCGLLTNHKLIGGGNNV